MSDLPTGRRPHPHTSGGRGVCVWFTGRSGAGKSTVAHALVPRLEADGRTVSVLDVVPALRKARCERTSEAKLLRKAFVAREVVRHGGVVVCVTVSARRSARDAAREMIGPESFVEVFVDAPAAVCEARRAARPGRPALRKRVRRRLRDLVGRLRPGEAVSFEEPAAPDLRVDSTRTAPEDAARVLHRLLQQREFLVPENARVSGPARTPTTSGGAS